MQITGSMPDKKIFNFLLTDTIYHKYTSKYVFTIKAMHGDADIFTDFEIVLEDKDDTIELINLLRQILSIKNDKHELQRRLPNWNKFFSQFPRDLHYHDSCNLAQVDSAEVYFYDASSRKRQMEILYESNG